MSQDVTQDADKKERFKEPHPNPGQKKRVKEQWNERQGQQAGVNDGKFIKNDAVGLKRADDVVIGVNSCFRVKQRQPVSQNDQEEDKEVCLSADSLRPFHGRYYDIEKIFN
ncbi:MAG: hypothetical protein HQL21_04525 [Candidatus Omnitrophica bacterium]|nr:hypothetical protein [Candidatus Omnitrophota bacterium]